MTRLILIINDVPAADDAWPRARPETGQQLDLLICAPHLPLQAARWLTSQQRALWRQDWASALAFRWQALCHPADVMRATLVRGPLHAALARLQSDDDEAGRLPARVLDLRRRRAGADLEPLRVGSSPLARRWVAPLLASSSLSAVLFLAD